MEKGERIGGAQQHQRLVASLNKHTQLATDKVKEVDLKSLLSKNRFTLILTLMTEHFQPCIFFLHYADPRAT